MADCTESFYKALPSARSLRLWTASDATSAVGRRELLQGNWSEHKICVPGIVPGHGGNPYGVA